MKKKILWILGSLLLLAIILIILAHTPPVKSMVLKQARKNLAKSFNISLTARSLDYNLFTLHVSLKDVSLGIYDKPSAPPFLKADKVVMRLTPGLILGKRIDFREIRVIAPTADIRVNPDGSLNIPPQLLEKPEGPETPLFIRTLHIENGRLIYKNLPAGYSADLRAVYLDGTLIDKGKQQLTLHTREPGNLQFNEQTIKVKQVEITTRLDDKEAAFRLNTLVPRGNEPLNIAASFQWDRDRLTIPQFHLTAAGGELRGNGTFYTGTGQTTNPNRLSFAWKSLNLQSPLLTAFFPHPVYSTTSGNLDLRFVDFSLENMSGIIAASFIPLQTPTPGTGQVPLAGQVAASLETGKIIVGSIHLMTAEDRSHPAMSLRGKLQVDNDRFQGELEGFYKGEPKIDGHLRLSGQVSGDASSPRIRARIESKGIQVGESLTLIPRGTLTYENHRLKTRDLEVQTLGGQVTVSGVLPLEAPLPGQPNPLDLAVRAKDIPLEQLIHVFQGDTPVQGTLSLAARLKPNRIEADLFLANLIYGLKDPIKPGDIQCRLEISGNRVDYRLQTLAPDLSAAIEGSGKMTSPYPLKGTVLFHIPSLENLSKRQGFQALEGVSGDIKGRVDFSLNLSDPAKTLSASAAVDRFFMRTWERELVNREPIRLSYSARGIAIESLDLKGPGSSIQASGFLPLEPGPGEGITLRAEIDSRLLNPFVEPLQLDGCLVVTSRVSGSAAQPVLTSTVDFKNISFQEAGEQLSTGSGTGFNGRVEGRLVTSGAPRDVRDFSAEATFSVLQLDFPGMISLHPSQPVQLRLKNGELLLEQVSFTDEKQWSRLDLSGSVKLTGEKPLNLSVAGFLDARLLNLLTEEIEMTGKSTFAVRVSGEFLQPELAGTAEIQNVRLRHRTENLFIHQLNGRLHFSGNRVQVESLNGDLNGGTMTITGEMTYDTGGIQGMELKMTAENSRFEYPKGLFSELDGSLALTWDKTGELLAGTVNINGAVYKEPLNVMTQLTDYLRSPPAAEIPGEQDAFPERMRFDIRLLTTSPILINNNISRSEVDADVNVGGTYLHPTLSGRITIKEGGKIYLGDNTYSIESGAINFLDPYRIEPDFLIRARTKVGGYDILLNLKGTPETFSAAFTSTPPLSEPNIISLLTTGKTLQSVSGSILDTTGSQALAYISGSLSGKVRQAVRQTLGIDNVRIDGSLIASRENPGARLTLGQQLTPKLELTMSQSLKETQNRTWILDYKPFPTLSLQGLKRDRDKFTAAGQYEFRWGLGPGKKESSPGKSKTTPGKKTVADILFTFTGDTGEAAANEQEKALRKTLKLHKNKPFNYFTYQADLERLRTFYRKQDYLQAEILPVREEKNGRVTIRYTIDPGPRIFLDFQGVELPRKFKKKIAKLWMDGQFDQYRSKTVIQALRGFLFAKGYYRAEAIPGTPLIDTQTNTSRFTFTVKKGKKYRKPTFYFPGHRLVPHRELYRCLKTNRLLDVVFYQPGEAVQALKQHYAGRGFPDADIRAPAIRFFPDTRKITVTFPIREGALFKVGEITVSGNRFLDAETIENAISLKKNGLFLPAKFNETRYEITAFYARKGFNHVQVTTQKQVLNDKGLVNLFFQVRENRRGIIREILITGNTLTRVHAIRRELTFKQGDIVDFREINKSRKKLYDLGIFARVNIEAVPLDTAPPTEADTGEADQPFRVDVRVTEIPPFSFKGGLQWDTENGPGIVMEMHNANIAGRVHYLGGSFSYDMKETNARVYYRFPYFMGKKIATEFFLFTNRRNESSFTVKRTGLTLQQQFRPWKAGLFSWNYTREQTHTVMETIQGDAQPPGTTLRLAHLNATFTYDRRNNLLNPTRGIFISNSIQYAGKFLGSDANFSRYFGEFHWYRPLIKRFLVSASSIKIGLGSGLDQNLPGERFFAGGSTSVRGFKQDTLGPQDPITGSPLGGEAVFIFKQELRARLNPLFSAVLFADFGNVYARGSEFNPFNVRKTAGFGIRLHTGPLLLRLDWGFKLDRKPGESPSRIYLSIGQAF